MVVKYRVIIGENLLDRELFMRINIKNLESGLSVEHEAYQFVGFGNL